MRNMDYYELKKIYPKTVSIIDEIADNHFYAISSVDELDDSEFAQIGKALIEDLGTDADVLNNAVMASLALFLTTKNSYCLHTDLMSVIKKNYSEIINSMIREIKDHHKILIRKSHTNEAGFIRDIKLTAYA